MRAIVTGGAGFIGQNLTNRLIEMGWEVIVIDDFSTHESTVWPETKAKVMPARVQDAIAPRDHIDAIFHLAGKVGPIGVTKFKGRIASDTIDAASKVGDWASMYGCRLVLVSTSEVYGDSLRRNSESDLPVIQPPSARSEYASSKLAAEYMLYNRDDISLIRIRPFNVSGYGQRLDGGFVIPRFVRQALSGEPLTIYSPGTQKRSFTHVDDFIDGVVIALAKGEDREVFNVGTETNKETIKDIAYKVLHHTGSESELVTIDPVRLHGPAFKEAPDKIPNSNKLRTLGWNPTLTTDDIIKDVIDYYRSIENAESTSSGDTSPQ